MTRIDLLEKGDTLPTLSLPEASGEEFRLSDFRGRRNLVLFVAHPVGCAACEAQLRALNDALDLLRGEAAEVLAAVPGRREPVQELKRRLALSFPVLIDAENSLGGKAILAVADRFGEIFAIARADEEHRLPAPAETAGELAFIGMQCPE
jgi:peroxiredoxin Q/BCP